MGKDNALLENDLLFRVGELMSHFGRYDMYAVLIESTLSHGASTRPGLPRCTLHSRGEAIGELMRKHELSSSLQAKFHHIDHEFKLVLARNEISANADAVVAGIPLRASRSIALPERPRDWYDYSGASEKEVLAFIAAMERDIVNVVALYMQLASLAGDIKASLATLH